MPREVYLDPSGSPFVHTTQANPALYDMSTESSLTDLSMQYLQDNDDLNSSNGLAGLADVTVGMGDETSVMRLQTSQSDELLMGVKGEEFLVDDSMMGFDTPILSRSTRLRSKLSQSTSFPPPVEAAEVEVEELIQVEKPKRKKSTRSRSSSPSKKNVAAEPAPQAVAPFPQNQMETMPEEPEPEPEPEPESKPRRSPRKARTRTQSTAESLPTFPISSSPFASTSTPTVPEPTPSPVPATQSEPAAEPQTARKAKRTSRVVGRPKSKSRSKSMQVEEPLEEDLQPAPIEQEPTTLPSEASGPEPQRASSPLVPDSPSPVETHAPEAAPVVPQVDARVSPTPPPAHHDLATPPTEVVKPPSVQADPGPSPFKFQLPPSFSRNRTHNATPVLGASTSTRMSFGLVPASGISKETTPERVEQEHKEPTQEEEAEAVEAAMRITRRDSMVFGHPRQSLLSESVEEHTAQGTPTMPSTIPEEHAASGETTSESTPAEAAPPKRTRVGRKSTRARGGARTSVAGRAAGKVEPIPEQEYHTPVSSPLAVSATPEVDENSNDNVQEEIAEEKQDVAVPVNFGSRSPSPNPEPAPTESPLPPSHQVEIQPEPQPEAPSDPPTTTSTDASSLSAVPPTKEPKSSPVPFITQEAPAKRRTTRSSMPAQSSHVSLPARTTRATRKSEVRPAPSRGDSGTSKPKVSAIEEKTVPEEPENPVGDAPVETVTTPARIDVSTAPIESTTPLDSPALPPSIAPEEVVEAPPQDTSEQMEDTQEPVPESTADPAAPRAAKQQKTLGSAAKRAPQRAVSASQSNAPQRTASGSSQTRRTVSSAAQKPGQSAKPASATQKPASTSKSIEPAHGPAHLSGPQRTASISSLKSSTQKPPSLSSTPPSTTSAPAKSGRPARIAAQRTVVSSTPTDSEAEQKASPVPTPNADDSEPKRAVRALPKRSARLSRDMKVDTIPEDSMEISSIEPEVEQIRTEAAVEEQVTPDLQHVEPAASSSIWPREPAANPFAPITASTQSEARASPRSGKRRASSPETEPEGEPNDSPSKRVRFSAVLEAGPTPGIGRVLKMPKPSLKVVKKPKFERKPNRPKRVLTRDWVVGEVPSYAAPLKRDIRVREDHTAPAETRPPLSEAQANTRVSNDKFKPTVPVAFTFRSELRMKPRAEEPLPAAIPIANPMPDFAAAHAAAEAASLTRRQRAQEAFLAAQAELEECRHAKYAIGSETARRAAERAVFDAAMKVKEAEAERVRMEQSRLEAERDAIELKEMRRKMVPKANPVPEFYKHIARNGSQEIETE